MITARDRLFHAKGVSVYMKLRKVKIIGFKSFRSRTGVEVGDGITAVVGPNGCGKSNIVDAVRWAMGSQSPKDLRGRAMEDVIFAGSSSSKPAGYAEVSLTFDNDETNSELPLEYREKPQIEVTRRLYRTGESEYEINQSRARLRDIQAIFAGTGVGSRDAYSIIEQGRIGFVVSARPEERRTIIEEAAGITRYKRQRQTAERRLDKTRENLLRVRDVLGEVRRQLGRLEREAKKAAKYRELTTELRGYELKLAVDRFKAAREKRTKQATVHEALVKQAEDAAILLETTSSRVDAERAALTNLEEASNETSEASYRARARVELLTNTVEHLESQLKEVTERITSLEGTADAESRRKIEQQEALGELQAAEEAASRALNDIQTRLRDAESAASDARRNFQEVRDEETALRREQNEVERELTRSRARLESLETEQEQSTGRLEGFEEELAEARQAAEALESEVAEREAEARAAEQRTEQRARELDEASEREQSLRSEQQEARAAVREVEKKLTSLSSRADALEASLARGESLAPTLRKVQRAVDAGELSGVLGPLVTRFRMGDAATSRVATVLGEAFEAILAESEDSAKALIRWARARDESLVVATLIEPFEGEVDEGCVATAPIPGWIAKRIQQFDVVPDILEHTGAEGLVDDQRTLADARGLWRRDARQGASERVVAQRTELEDLKRSLEELVEKESRLKASETGISDRLEAALRKRIEAQSIKDDATQTMRATKATHEDAMARRRRARASVERAEKDLERVTARRASVGEEQGRLESRLGELREKGEYVAARLDAIEARLTEVTENRERAESQLSDVRVEDAQIRERLRSARESVGHMKRELETAGARADQAVRAIADGRERKMRAEVERKQKIEELGTARRSSETAERIANEARERLDEASRELREREVHLAEVRRDSSDMEKRRAESEVALERARGEQERALEAIVERFQTPIDEAISQAERVVFDGDFQERVRELRGQIERLGAVNPAAEEAFEEAREREEFLASQKQDLEDAMADIESAIRKMDQTSRELFSETFEAVNAGFKEMFPRLFKGGKGRLELTDPDDLLATGIEIVVQPPGKRVQNMTLLSGGEKALTAVALIFSIFELKPTPFCILDEVDAPLDEANVGRFSDMVREISARSQFLIITHNTRTMEAADTLYGVTMETPGESKLVGVRLRGDAVQIAGGGEMSLD